MKRAVCALALLCCAVLCLAACAGRQGQPKPTSAVQQVTPDPDGEQNQTLPAKEGAGAALEAAPDTVLLRFTGLAEAEVTAGDIAALGLCEYTETTSADTPVFCGPLVKDVLSSIGASGAETIRIVLGGGAAERSFAVSELDLSTAMFAVLKEGEIQGEGTCTLICSTKDGFSHILNVNSAMVLE